MSKSETMAAPSSSDELLVQAFAKLDRTDLGVALGALVGLTVFAVTNFLILKGGEHIGQNLLLLSQFFIGYSVTFLGSLVGLVYGFVTGFVLGWSVAFLRNLLISIYLHIVRLKANMSSVQEFIDQP